jgi:hypothetical protein
MVSLDIAVAENRGDAKALSLACKKRKEAVEKSPGLRNFELFSNLEFSVFFSGTSH